MMGDNKNPFYERMKQYVGKRVTVVTKSTKEEIKGSLLAVNFTTANFIILGKDGEYFIRDDISYMKVHKEDDEE